MSVGIFVNKKHRPTMEEVSVAIGSKRPLWDRLTRFIVNNYRIKRDFTLYGKNYGWAVRFRAGGKALLSMYPGKESFTVQIVLSQTDAEQAFSLNLGKKVRKVIEEAHQFHEGRWLFNNSTANMAKNTFPCGRYNGNPELNPLFCRQSFS